MADDSWNVEPSLQFDPFDIPHGMKEYILKDLTPDQQRKLNSRKTEQIKSDQKYLAEHPEIRGLIIMILRILMKTRPKYDIYEVIGQYFTKSSVDLKQEIYAYLEDRESILAVNSTILLQKDTVSESVFSEKTEVEHEESILVETEIQVTEAEKLQEEHYPGVRWESYTEELEDVSSTTNICTAVLEQILENAIEEVDATSVGSIASIGFPVDYEDHHYSSHSEESID